MKNIIWKGVSAIMVKNDHTFLFFALYFPDVITCTLTQANLDNILQFLAEMKFEDAINTIQNDINSGIDTVLSIGQHQMTPFLQNLYTKVIQMVFDNFPKNNTKLPEASNFAQIDSAVFEFSLSQEYRDV